MSDVRNDLYEGENYGNMSVEALEALVERRKEEMRRKDVLKKYNIQQLPNGAWYTRIDGKKRQFKDRKELEDVIIVHEREKKETLVSIFPEFFKYRKHSVAESTWVLDVTNFRDYIKDSKIGNMPYKNITLSNVYDFFDECEKIKGKMRRKYWNKILNTLNLMFDYLINNGKLNRRPSENIMIHQDRFLSKKETEEKNTVFFADEQEAVCKFANEAAMKKRDGIPLGILVLFNLGLRIGELCDLKWSDIESDGEDVFLHIQRITVSSFTDDGHSNGRKELDRCKSKAGIRRLHLTPDMIKILDKIKEYNRMNRFPVGKDDYIFMRKYKGVIRMCTPKCYDKRLRGYCKKANMSEIKSCHDIRRTTLTNLYKKGVPLKAIQYIAGHATLRQTMDYLKITNEDIENMGKYLSLVSMSTD